MYGRTSKSALFVNLGMLELSFRFQILDIDLCNNQMRFRKSSNFIFNSPYVYLKLADKSNYLIFGTVKYSANHFHSKVLKCKYVLKQNPLFTQFCSKFIYNFVYTFKLIFCLLIVHIRLFYRQISELRFYGCCHPCFM